MIELLIGVPLTTVAWARGWKGWALLPLVAYFVVSFVVGFVWGFIRGPGMTEAELNSGSTIIGLVLFSVTVLILVAMIIKGKKRSTGSLPVEIPHNDKPAKVFCPKCGREQVDNANFCRNCGENLGLRSRYGCV